jgi:hypothetical protein
MIIISNRIFGLGKINKVTVFINGVPMGEIQPNKNINFELPQGEYKIFAKYMWYKSNTIDLEINSETNIIIKDNPMHIILLWVCLILFIAGVFKLISFLIVIIPFILLLINSMFSTNRIKISCLKKL